MRKKAPRMTRENKQIMHYSLYSGSVPVYERDEYGQIIYIDVDGEDVPVEAGTKEARYSMPVRFEAYISSELNEMHIKAWGVDQSSIYAEIVAQKGTLPLEIGAIIWRTSEITYDDLPDDPLETDDGNSLVDDENANITSDSGRKTPHQASSDYTVVGLRTEGLTEDWFLLQKNSSDGKNNPS